MQRAIDRHIEIIPEIDIPAHSHAAIKSMEVRYERLKNISLYEARRYRLREPTDTSVYLSPQLFTDNVINPCLRSSLDFVKKVLKEIQIMQPSLKILHLGGDEIPNGAWVNSTACRKFAENILHFQDLTFVKEIFLQNISSFMERHDLNLGAWEENLLDSSNNALDRNKFSNTEVYAYTWSNGRPLRTPYQFANNRYKVSKSASY